MQWRVNGGWEWGVGGGTTTHLRAVGLVGVGGRRARRHEPSDGEGGDQQRDAKVLRRPTTTTTEEEWRRSRGGGGMSTHMDGHEHPKG